MAQPFDSIYMLLKEIICIIYIVKQVCIWGRNSVANEVYVVSLFYCLVGGQMEGAFEWKIKGGLLW